MFTEDNAYYFVLFIMHKCVTKKNPHAISERNILWKTLLVYDSLQKVGKYIKKDI